MENSGIVTGMSVDDSANTDNCFYFVTTRETSKVELEFIFSSANGVDYFGLGKVAVISKNNLVINGNFDDMDQSAMMPTTEPWIISQCATCSVEVNDGTNPDLSQSLICSGVPISVRQVINLNTVGRRTVYRLKFSLGYKSGAGAKGSLIVKLKST